MKKITLSAIGVFLALILALIYFFDRICSSFLFIVPIKDFAEWFPKTTDEEEIKKTFPTLPKETIEAIIYDRSIARNQMYFSFMRSFVYILILVIYSLIF